jgi:DNA-binding LytR/AlgR family response regulator
MERTGFFSGNVGQPRLKEAFWERSLGSFYSQPSNRLLCYLIMASAYIICTYASITVLKGPNWLLAHLDFSSAFGIHAALIYAGGYLAVDFLADRLGTGAYIYQRRTVASQWLVMFAGFLLAYAVHRATYLTILDFYAPWVVYHFEVNPEQRRTIAFELLYFSAWWLPKALAITWLPLYLQKKVQQSGAKQKRSREEALAGSIDQTCPPVFAHEVNGESIKIAHAQITHVSSEDHYCRIHHQTSHGVKHHLLRLTLKQLLEELKEGNFFRIHRSHLVNLEHALGWKSERHKRFMVLEHGTVLPISRGRMAELKPMLERLKLPKLN